MYHNRFMEEDSSSNVRKLTKSNDQLIHLHDTRIIPKEDKNTLRKVMSLNPSEMETKHKSNVDNKAFKVKLTRYTNMQKNFINASNHLIKSYEEIKKFQKDSQTDKNTDFEELDLIVKNVIEKQFGIKLLESNTLLKRDHKVFSPNLNLPLSLDISSTSGYQTLDLAIKELYDDVWKVFLEISETNMKYYFWLRHIVEPNEFCDIHDLREYLIQNMFNKEQTDEQLDSKLKYFYTNLQFKLINIINEINEVLKPEKYTTIEQKNNEIKELETNAETKYKIAIEDHKRKMDVKIKTLEIENEKLKVSNSENSKQISTLLGEIKLQNRKLTNTKERLALLTKEKNDLISMITKMEVKEEGIQTLQNKFEKEQEKNRHLRSIIAKEYENRGY